MPPFSATTFQNGYIASNSVWGADGMHLSASAPSGQSSLARSGPKAGGSPCT